MIFAPHLEDDIIPALRRYEPSGLIHLPVPERAAALSALEDPAPAHVFREPGRVVYLALADD